MGILFSGTGESVTLENRRKTNIRREKLELGDKKRTSMKGLASKNKAITSVKDELPRLNVPAL